MHVCSFDVAMGQKSWFKAQETGTFIKRHTFPQIPGTELNNPKVIVTERGTKLLVDGLWGVVRKPSESPSMLALAQLLLTRRSNYRLHLRLVSSGRVGTLSRPALLHSLLLPGLPHHHASPPQRARRRQVRPQIQEVVGRVPTACSLFVSDVLFALWRTFPADEALCRFIPYVW